MRRKDLLKKRGLTLFWRRERSNSHRNQARGPARMLDWKGEDRWLFMWFRGLSEDARSRFMLAEERAVSSTRTVRGFTVTLEFKGGPPTYLD
jgi:hypothetical protein